MHDALYMYETIDPHTPTHTHPPTHTHTPTHTDRQTETEIETETHTDTRTMCGSACTSISRYVCIHPVMCLKILYMMLSAHRHRSPFGKYLCFFSLLGTGSPGHMLRLWSRHVVVVGLNHCHIVQEIGQLSRQEHARQNHSWLYAPLLGTVAKRFLGQLEV